MSILKPQSPPFFKWMGLVFLLGLGAAAINTAIASRRSGATGVEVDSDNRKLVSTKEIGWSEISHDVVMPARIAAENQTEIRSDMEGYVSERKVKLGERVRRGQAMFFIKSSDALAGYRPFLVTSPIDGNVTSLAVSEGERIQPTTPLAVVSNIGKVKILAEGTDEDLLRLKPGMPGSFKNNTNEVPVRLGLISGGIDPITGTAHLEFSIDGQDSPVRINPGAIGTVLLKTSVHQGILIDQTALIYQSTGIFVAWIDEKSIAHHQSVSILNSFDSQVEVEGKELFGKTIVLRTPRFVSDGDTVEIQKSEAGANAE